MGAPSLATALLQACTEAAGYCDRHSLDATQFHQARLNSLLDHRANRFDNGHMTGNEFIRKVRRLGRKQDVRVAFVPRRGKGSHGTLFYGARFTVVRNPKDELKTGTLHAMLEQLGLRLDEL